MFNLGGHRKNQRFGGRSWEGWARIRLHGGFREGRRHEMGNVINGINAYVMLKI